VTNLCSRLFAWVPVEFVMWLYVNFACVCELCLWWPMLWLWTMLCI
jgi:hypothetical protein